MKNTRTKMGITGVCALVAATMISGSVFAQTSQTAPDAAGVAVAMTGGQDEENRTLAPAGVAAPFATAAIGSGAPADEHAAIVAFEARQAAYAKVFENIAVSQVANYVNIRQEPNAEAEILGKIYNECAATILETVEQADGTWYKITSGSVEGYIKADYFVTGEEAEQLAKNVGKVEATIKTDTLRLREEPALDSETLSLLSADETYTITNQVGDFLELSIDTDLTGYVYKDYVNIDVSFNRAISLEEERAEQERLERLERERQEAEEQMRREQEEASRAAAQSSTKKSTTAANGETTKKSTTAARESTKKSTTAAEQKAPSDSGSVSSKRYAIAAYAESFVGAVPYVYGGNSLSTGVDCSGFVQQVFSHYGISLPRSSDSQGSCGTSVSSSNMKPGDIVHYKGHVAIYIGDGCVVHASSPSTGVKISSWNYRTPESIRNVID